SAGGAGEPALRATPRPAAESPAPVGADRPLLDLLDIADLTTGADGARVTPATRLRDLVDRRAPADPGVRTLVATVARLGRDPALRALVELVAPHAHAAGTH